MERSRILEYLAKLVLNCRSEAAAVKAEEDRLKEKRQKAEHKAERIMEVLRRECDGENTDCGVATVKFRATERVEVADSSAATISSPSTGMSSLITYGASRSHRVRSVRKKNNRKRTPTSRVEMLSCRGSLFLYFTASVKQLIILLD